MFGYDFNLIESKDTEYDGYFSIWDHMSSAIIKAKRGHNISGKQYCDRLWNAKRDFFTFLISLYNIIPMQSLEHFYLFRWVC